MRLVSTVHVLHTNQSADHDYHTRLLLQGMHHTSPKWWLTMFSPSPAWLPNFARVTICTLKFKLTDFCCGQSGRPWCTSHRCEPHTGRGKARCMAERGHNTNFSQIDIRSRRQRSPNMSSPAQFASSHNRRIVRGIATRVAYLSGAGRGYHHVCLSPNEGESFCLKVSTYANHSLRMCSPPYWSGLLGVLGTCRGPRTPFA